MRSILLLLVAMCSIFAGEPPDWTLVGILAKETQSSYATAPGTPITYVDRRVGKDGELGPFQMTQEAFDQVSTPAEAFTRLKTDTRYAEKKAKEYLCWLYDNGAKHDWSIAVAMYNVGPTGWRRLHSRAIAYLRSVRRLGGG